MPLEMLFIGAVIGFATGLVTLKSFNNQSELPNQAESKWDTDRIRSAFDSRGRGFEMLIAKYFALDYDNVSMTQKTRDGGYDVLVQNQSEKILIEAKMTSGSVEAETARSLTGVGVAKGADAVIIITTSDLSSDGKEHISEFNRSHKNVSTRVIDGDEFCELLNESILQPPWHKGADS